MKYLKTYKIFEASNSYAEGDIVLIKYWENGEIVPVKIVKKSGPGYLVSFKTGLSGYDRAPDQVIKPYDIIQVYKSVAAGVVPNKALKQQSMTINNDLTINNYPKSI